ncbi:hypothetical protein [Bacillus taeanensis]|uniref:Asp23/Gls24 family envelope stress response protein n=1 Tax=Bacillus taeanensis TaxID=273032 RepID=A0A366XY89_9BACI|nr:hypothetical protein [Bacillus taeanensis]RBW71112.1 hypothetical protein DS031_03715 [Bacillus taeanensis]
MQVFALVGPSGTGKSTSALSFAHSKHIPAIIDDGMLIYKGRKAAGFSAKYEKNYITAIKRAIFFYDDHLKEVQEAINLLAIHSILIIGTSIKMVNQIAEKLNIGMITKYYHVEEIRSSKEINMALYVRKTEGKHIIPLPYIQVEHNFIKRMIMHGKKIFSPQKEIIGETTIIRPNFQQGVIHISEHVIKRVVSHGCTSIDEVRDCTQIDVNLTELPKVKVNLSLYYTADKTITDIAKIAQEKVAQDIKKLFNIELDTVDIVVEKLIIKAN